MTQTFSFIRIVLCAGFVLVGGWVLAQEHTRDSLETVKKKVAAKEALLIDVREQTEWEDGHLRDARLLPLSKLREKDHKEVVEKTLSKDKVIYLHCASGKRCLMAADILKQMGYDARALKSGYKDLLKAGFPKDE